MNVRIGIGLAWTCAGVFAWSLGFVPVGGTAWADNPSVSVTGVPVDQDTTISVKKGRTPEPDYRVDSGTEEISGEPLSGQQGSYESWKKACADWKKEMREMNGKSLITLNCGTPHATRDQSSLVTQTSTGTYKIKVRIRDAEGGSPDR